jgi:hypothetical protein
MQIIAPTYNSQLDHQPVQKLDTGYSRGIGRFTGNHYVKVVFHHASHQWSGRHA